MRGRAARARLSALLRRQRTGARSTAARLLLDVPDEPTPHEAQAGLRRALSDPTLELVLWQQESLGYVDADGLTVQLPRESRGRAVTRIDYEDHPVAALLHDDRLLAAPALLEEVVAAARVALEKDRTLRAVRASEARMRALLDALPDLMLRVARDGTCLAVKAPADGGLAIPDLAGRRLDEWLPVPVAERLLDAGRRALAAGHVQTVEYELTDAGARTRHCEARVVAGGPDEFLLVVRDFTQQREQHEQLQLERDLVRTVVDTAPTLFCAVEPDGAIVRFNRALEQLSGRADDEAVRGRPFWETFVTPDDAAEVERAFLDDVRSRRPSEHEHAWRSAGGGHAVVAWEANWYPGPGGADRFLITGSDVTERTRHQHELQRQHDFLNAIANYAPSLLCLVDAEGRVPDRAANRAFERLLGYEPEAIGGQLFWEAFVAPSDAQEVRRRIQAVVAGEPVPEQDSRWLTSDGRHVVVAWSCTALPRIDDRRLYLVCGLDVTERRSHEDELRRSRARLVEAADAERARLERNLHDGAQQRLVALSLSLRLAQATARTDPDRTAEVLEQAGAELAQALEELRELARGIHPAVLTERGLEAAVESLAARSPVPVELELPSERLPGAVETAAYYVVSEALANVAKYAQARRVHVRIGRGGGRAVIEVGDDGVGGADLRHGTGLRGLVDRVAALDGHLEVESPHGSGTRVRAELPLDAGPAAVP